MFVSACWSQSVTTTIMMTNCFCLNELRSCHVEAGRGRGLSVLWENSMKESSCFKGSSSAHETEQNTFIFNTNNSVSCTPSHIQLQLIHTHTVQHDHKTGDVISPCSQTETTEQSAENIKKNFLKKSIKIQ